MENRNQKEFSEFVLKGILQNFPQFSDNYCFNDNIVVIEQSSKTGSVSLWITTQNVEITVGFDNEKGECIWHTHMSLYGANEPEEELKQAIILIENILTGKEIIVIDSNFNYYLTQNPESEIAENIDGDNLKFRKWIEL